MRTSRETSRDSSGSPKGLRYARASRRPLVAQAFRPAKRPAGSPKGQSGNNCATLAADASRRAALLVAFIHPVCALLAPCRAGASTPRVAHLFPDGPLRRPRFVRKRELILGDADGDGSSLFELPEQDLVC